MPIVVKQNNSVRIWEWKWSAKQWLRTQMKIFCNHFQPRLLQLAYSRKGVQHPSVHSLPVRYFWLVCLIDEEGTFKLHDVVCRSVRRQSFKINGNRHWQVSSWASFTQVFWAWLVFSCRTAFDAGDILLEENVLYPTEQVEWHTCIKCILSHWHCHPRDLGFCIPPIDHLVCGDAGSKLHRLQWKVSPSGRSIHFWGPRNCCMNRAPRTTLIWTTFHSKTHLYSLASWPNQSAV